MPQRALVPDIASCPYQHRKLAARLQRRKAQKSAWRTNTRPARRAVGGEERYHQHWILNPPTTQVGGTSALWRKGFPWVTASILQSFMYCTILRVLTPKCAFLQNRHAEFVTRVSQRHSRKDSLDAPGGIPLWNCMRVFLHRAFFMNAVHSLVLTACSMRRYYS